MNTAPYDNETYDEFRERVFGSPYDIWHDGLPHGVLKNITNEHERKHIAKMLTEGVLVHDDSIAVDAWEEFDIDQGVRLLKPLVKLKSGKQSMTTIVSFLQKHDPKITAFDLKELEDILCKVINNVRNDQDLDAIISARNFPSKKIINALLNQVENSKEYLVRYHASNSLLKMIDKHHQIDDDSELFQLVVCRFKDGRPIPRTNTDLARHKKAAQVLRERLKHLTNTNGV